MSNKIKIFQDDEKSLIHEFAPIFGVAWCAKKLNREPKEIRSYIRKNKHLRPISISDLNMTNLITRYADIWNPHVCYILGLIWADGTLFPACKGSPNYNIKFSIKIEDAREIFHCLDHFDWMVWKILETPARKYVKNGKTTISTKMGLCCLYDRYFGKFLLENDYKIKSGASADKILKLIPENLKKYWWRGFLDGDGCVYTSSRKIIVSFTSSIDQNWEFAENLCKIMKIRSSLQIVNGKSGKRSHFNIIRKNDALDFLDFVYEGRELDGIGLSRKYLKYKNSNLSKTVDLKDEDGIVFTEWKQMPWSVTINGNITYHATYESAKTKMEKYGPSVDGVVDTSFSIRQGSFPQKLIDKEENGDTVTEIETEKV